MPREAQDRLAAASHAKAAAAQVEGRFKAEIVPIEITIKEDNGKFFLLRLLLLFD